MLIPHVQKTTPPAQTQEGGMCFVFLPWGMAEVFEPTIPSH